MFVDHMKYVILVNQFYQKGVGLWVWFQNQNLFQAHSSNNNNNNNNNKCTGVCIPRLLTAWSRLRKQQNKSAKHRETAKHNQYNRQPRVMKTVGVTGKTAKWLQKNELQKFLHCSFSTMQVFHRHRSIHVDRQEWEHKLCIRRLSHHKIWTRNR